MAADATVADTVVALGGDGLIHEVVGGLMELPAERRPRLAVIAMGSGNDFARTIGAALNKPARAIEGIVKGVERPYDLGLVDAGTPQATYYAETLSFGLDAAIALDTTDRRDEGTKQHGAGLFATSGLHILSQAHSGWPYRLSYVDARGTSHSVEGIEVMLALQAGPTYGGGFPITPAASPTDGLLDLCYSVDVPSVPITLGLFGLVRLGRHTRSRHLALDRFSHAEVSFPGEEPPTQVDGERLTGSEHSIDVCPAALRVVFPG
jgi:diacylglycerol kinase family enzyme